MAPDHFTITVVYGYADKQTLIPLSVTPGTTVKQAILQSAITRLWPEINLSTAKIGIFSKIVTLDTLVKNGDRIEIYRPLKIDPKQARIARQIKAAS